MEAVELTSFLLGLAVGTLLALNHFAIGVLVISGILVILGVLARLGLLLLTIDDAIDGLHTGS